MPIDVGLLTKTLNAFIFVLSGGYSRALPDALLLMQKLLVLEIVMLGAMWALGRSEWLAELLMKSLWFGALLWFLTSWPTLSWVVVKSFIQVGLHIGGDALEMKDFLDPTAIMRYGMAVVGVVFTQLTSFSGFGAIMHLPSMFILGLAAIGIWLAYFILAAQIFVSILEFYIVGIFVVILLPFGVFRHTAFLAEKAFAVVIGAGIKLGVLAVITSIILPVLITLQIGPNPTLSEVFVLLAVAGLLAILSWQTPALAASILMGSPSLHAGTLAHGALAAAAGTVLSAAAVDRVSRGVITATQHATAGTSALITAGRTGGVRGIGQLGAQVGRSLSQATIGQYRAAAQRGSGYARGAMNFRAAQIAPPVERPRGRNDVPLGE